MTEQDTPAYQPASAPAPARSCRGRGRGRAAAFIILVAIAAGAAGGLISRAFGHEGPPWQAFMGGPVDPARLDDHVEHMIRHFAIEVDATADQQAKLATIAKSAAHDLMPMREKAQAARKEAVALLTAPTIDRGAIERLRADQISLAETASKRISQALADAADVLTPEQRKNFADRVSYFRHSRWHRD